MSFLEARLAFFICFKCLENKYGIKRVQELVEVYHGKLDELNSQLTMSKFVSQRKELSGNTYPKYASEEQ